MCFDAPQLFGCRIKMSAGDGLRINESDVMLKENKSEQKWQMCKLSSEDVAAQIKLVHKDQQVFPSPG